MSYASVQPLFDQAVAHHQAGQLRQAEAIYRQILAKFPRHPDALHHLGMIAHQVGKNKIALDLVSRAIAINTNAPEYHNTLGEIHRVQKTPELAEQSYRKAIEVNPHVALFYNNLSLALRMQRRMPEAIVAGRKAVELDDGLSSAHLNLANALSDSNEFDESIVHYQKAAALKPGDAMILTSMGTTFCEMGQFNDGMDCFNRAIALNDSPDAHLNRGFVHLLHEDFQHGWEDFEWRWQSTDFPSPRLATTKPRWDGSHIPGKTLLLLAEQGAGDAIQFIRYASNVAERSGGNVVVMCDPELKKLFQSVRGVSSVVSSNEPLPSFDFHLPLLSLPCVFKTNLRSIPNSVPYLTVDAELISKWRNRIGATAPRHIGLVWQGKAAHGNDRNRSMPLKTLAPLAAVENVQWISLQKDFGAEQIAQVSPQMKLLNFADEIHDFSDTAAIIMNLDLVIGVDTAVVHLAGALGKPVWTMLPFIPEWRWLRDRSDSPWYPTMRLFRQSKLGAWSDPVNQIVKALQQTE